MRKHVKRLLTWLRFCWGRVQFFLHSQVDCFQIAFAPRRVVKAEVAEQFAAMREATKAIRAIMNKPAPVDAPITVVTDGGMFQLPQSSLNSLAVMLWASDGFSGRLPRGKA